jgi:hypothetical protein
MVVHCSDKPGPAPTQFCLLFEANGLRLTRRAGTMVLVHHIHTLWWGMPEGYSRLRRPRRSI